MATPDTPRAASTPDPAATPSAIAAQAARPTQAAARTGQPRSDEAYWRAAIPTLIHRLAYRRARAHPHGNVRGYKEQGSTATPASTPARDDVHRFSPTRAVTGPTGPNAPGDPSEIRDWKWSP